MGLGRPMITTMDLLEGAETINGEIIDGVAETPEKILDRVVQIPIRCDPSSFELRGRCSNCRDEGCSRCQEFLECKRYHEGLVTVADLRRVDSSDRALTFPYPDIPIVEIGPRERFHARFIVERRPGHTNANNRALVVAFIDPAPGIEMVSGSDGHPRPLGISVDSIGALRMRCARERISEGLYEVRLKNRRTVIHVRADDDSGSLLTVETDMSETPLDLVKRAIQELHRGISDLRTEIAKVRERIQGNDR